jgi:hypothetical protein
VSNSAAAILAVLPRYEKSIIKEKKCGIAGGDGFYLWKFTHQN